MSNDSSGKPGVSRRDFMKTAAAGAAGVGLAASLGGKAVTEAAVPKLAVRKVSKPPYTVVGPYERFDEKYTMFVQGSWKAEYRAKRAAKNGNQTFMARMASKEPGYTREDMAFYMSSWGLAKSMGNEVNSANVGWNSWKPIGGNTAMFYNMPKHPIEDPARMSEMIKKIGRFWGAGDVGISKLDERWVYDKVARYGPNGRAEESMAIQASGQSVPVIIDPAAERPSTIAEQVVIPKSMENVITFVIPHRFAAQMTSPSGPASAAVGLGYSMMQFLASLMAEYIRALGYQAIPCGNDMMLSIPTAIDAGLGELGRNGLLIHPVFGAATRLCRVITDLPLVPDTPIEFGVWEFCKTCKKCAEECPADCISHETEPFTTARCDANNPGVLKWPIAADLCHLYWAENGNVDCSSCQRSCPYTKRQFWTHDVTKRVIAAVPAVNSMWVKLDDLMGFGFRQDPAEWWSKEEL